MLRSLLTSLEDLNFKDTSQTNSLDAFAKDTTTPELIALVRELGQRAASH